MTQHTPPPPGPAGPYGTLNPHGGAPAQSGPPSGPSTGPSGPPRPRRRTGRILLAAVAALAVLGGGTWYAATRDGGGHDDGPSAGAPAHSAPASPGGPSAAPPAGPDTAGAARINAGRKPGDAKALWLRKNDTDLPNALVEVLGPWTVGDTIVTATHRTVSAYGTSDGRLRWSLSLDRDLCRATPTASAEGRIAVVTRLEPGPKSECRSLRMIDLRTGKQGWQKKITQEGPWDAFTDYSLAITGDTVTAGRVSFSTAYRLSDGRQLFRQAPGRCTAQAFAGGPALIASLSCQDGTADVPHEQIQEVDPVTGRARWTYDIKRGYHIDHVYSVRPLVVSLYDRANDKRAVLALTDKGARRSALVGPDQYAPGCTSHTSDTNSLQNCRTVTDGRVFWMATRASGTGPGAGNQVVGFDLNTGTVVRRVSAPPGRLVMPLRMSGPDLLVEVLPAPTGTARAGAVASAGPGATAFRPLLRLPESSAKAHLRLDEPNAVYQDGRYFLVSANLVGDDAHERTSDILMAFGP
ncbi:outer membrane protein assembly factor BamB family protein [Streptomyces lavendulocolor]|uniref:outer membrane protein assembly factor BamB family protein n=1 Tax=Streptomyces lavendulocolor TaxID=67316 RepID=UPI0031D48FFD